MLHGFRYKSYVRRDSCATAGQQRAYAEFYPQFGIHLDKDYLNFPALFKRDAPCFLEIGFGAGQSLFALAKQQPEFNFIGVETHKPGIGSLLLNVVQHQLGNVRLHHGDVIDFLAKGIAPGSLHGIQIFFPDPWPKRRHHPRRLIQSDLIKTLSEKLITNGILHLATDWDDYAVHMMRVLSQDKQLINCAGEREFASRSSQRPVITRFEQRALDEGRSIWELQFQRG